MRVNKQGKKAIDRETYRTMESANIDMSEYYMEGMSGGLILEAMELNQHPELVEFLRAHKNKFEHVRDDGTKFNIRINGAEVKEEESK